MSPCFDYSASYLSKYPKTTSELTKKLKEKGFSDEDIEMTIPRLEQSGFLNDRLWAKLYIASLGRKGKPKAIIAMKMREKGVSKEIFEKVRGEGEEDISHDMQAKILKLVEQFKRKGLSEMEIKQKLYARGYSKAHIHEVLLDK